MPFEPSRLAPTRIDLALAGRLHAAAEDEVFSVLIEAAHGAPPPALRPARLAKREILALAASASVYKIWLNHKVRALDARALATIKADAAHAAFHATGGGIVWAIADSGIAPHSRFDRHASLSPPHGIAHHDFSGGGDPLADDYGHGTQVAGIAASVAPAAKLLSLKVLGPDGSGEVSDVLDALDYIQKLNDHGRRLIVHGVNLSLGYEFDPEWFACGASPLCREVDRLVQSGVVVVVAAGNSGYGCQNSFHSINDPGNAELAITVGSTHRDMPHTYGVSYFSSKGPTGDGRAKPDLLAPGERILCCAPPSKAPAGQDWRGAFIEDSGTSMAAPHVSGAIAAFLSARREFIGKPHAVKEIFLDAATDLRRIAAFQGRGLVNLFQALQER